MPTLQSWIQLAVYLAVLLLLAWPLGKWLAAVADGRLPRWLGPIVRVENAIYRLAGVDAGREHVVAALCGRHGRLQRRSACSSSTRLQRLQGVAAAQSAGAWPAVSPDSSFNTAVSFVTNTNWQGYGGESTMSYLTQMLAPGGAELLLRRDRHRRRLGADPRLRRAHVADGSATSGSTSTRSTLYVLLPISLVFALVLVSQGVIQNFDAYKDATTLEVNAYQQPKNGPDGQPLKDAKGEPVMEDVKAPTQSIADGPDRLAGGDQDARHQRRRLLQRQLGASVREPDAALQLRSRCCRSS